MNVVNQKRRLLVGAIGLFSLLASGCGIYNRQITSSTSIATSSEPTSNTTSEPISSSEPTSVTSSSEPTSTTSSATSTSISTSVTTSSTPTSTTSSATSTSISTSITSSTPTTSSTSSSTSSTSSTSEVPPVVEPTKLKYTMQDYYDNSAYYNVSSTSTTGDLNFLVIPIWFNESDTYIKNKENVREDIDKAFNADPNDIGWHSVSSFYKEESKGMLNLTVTVSDWYECGKSFTKYSDIETGSNFSLMIDAIDWYFSNSGDDRKKYDNNGDGYLEGMYFITAIPDYVSLNSYQYSNYWPYVTYISDSKQKNTAKPGLNQIMWAPYNFMYDAEHAYRRAGTYYAMGDNSNNRIIDAHAFIHESGHILGLDDYYDYSDNGYCPAGSFSMQDENIGGHDPYSVLAYGWGEVYKPTQSCEITLNPFQDTNQVILISDHEVSSVFDEYLLIEFYTPTNLNYMDSKYTYTGRDKGPTKAGIRLWHVDSRLAYLTASGSFCGINDLVTNPKINYGYGVMYAFSNSYSSSYVALGKQYINYNILQFIRNDKLCNYRPTSSMSNSDLFYEGDSFTIDNYSSQFVKGAYMNSKANLNWSFEVGEVSDTQATIKLTKLA